MGTNNPLLSPTMYAQTGFETNCTRQYKVAAYSYTLTGYKITYIEEGPPSFSKSAPKIDVKPSERQQRVPVLL